MKQISSSPSSTSDQVVRGWINGLVGVVMFSGSLPATRLAVLEFDPVFLTVARASIAGVLALFLLVAFKARRPARHQLLSLVIVAGGVVLGFPLLTALALKYVTSAHSIVFIGLLPLATAIRCATWRRTSSSRFLAFLCLGQCDRCGFCFMARAQCISRRRRSYAAGGYRLRARLCRGSQAGAGTWRLAGHFLGFADLVTGNGVACYVHEATDLYRYKHNRMG